MNFLHSFTDGLLSLLCTNERHLGRDDVKDGLFKLY